MRNSKNNAGDFKSPISYIFWLFFLLSGISALIYQILWIRFFALCIGSTIYSASAVTAAYMGGLAAGAYMPGRLADKVVSPLKYYAVFETLIGVYALLFMFFSPYIDAAGVALGGICAKFAFVMAVLIVPTILMGATLPFVATCYVRIFKPANKEFAVSLLYGVNALGGVLGIFLAGFFLIYLYGNTITTVIAAAGNFIVASLAFLMAGYAIKPQTAVCPGAGADETPDNNSRRQNAAWPSPLFFTMTAFFMVGFCALALEIILTRLLVLIIGTSTYAFSLIIMAFIGGIPLGSILVPLIIRKTPRMAAFGVVLTLLAIASLLTIPLLSAAPFIFLKIFGAFHADFTTFMAVEYLLCLLILMLPATLSGYAFTCALGAVKSSEGTIGRDVAKLYFYNTAGSVLGAIAAPFIFIKNLGLQNSIITISLVYLISGLALIAASASGRRIKLIRSFVLTACYIVIFFFSGNLDMDIISAGVHYHPDKFGGKSVKEIINHIKKEKRVFLAEGIDSTVGIYSKHEVVYLKINGKTDASTGWYDMNTQVLLAHLPMMLSRANRKVVIIGLGAGVTAGAALKYNPELLECVEINPNVIEGARFFNKISGLDFNAPNFKIIEEDALTHLKITNNKYDVIISEPSNPWIAGIASLFTYEHFTRCREKLSEKGLMCQWLQLYSMSKEDFIRILVTYQKVFPNATLWYSSWGDALIIGTKTDYDYDLNVIKKRFENEEIKKQLNLIEIFSTEALLAHQILDSETLLGLSAKYPDIKINTNSHQILEFSAPINYYNQNSEQITNALLAMQNSDKLYLKKYYDFNQPDENSYESLARAYYKLKMLERAHEFFKKAADKNPALWYIHLMKAEKLFNEKLLYEALNEVQIALFLAPDKRQSYYALLKIAIELQDFYSIIRVFNEGEKYFSGPDRYQYYLAVGVGYEGLDEYFKAAESYKKAIETFPDCFSAHKNLGLMYYKLNSNSEAVKYLNSAYKIKANDEEVLEALSKLHGGK